MADWKYKPVVALAAVLVIAAGCSSSAKPTGAGGSGSTKSIGSAGGSSHTYTVGVLADLTGPAASNSLTLIQGLKAGVGLAASEGYTIKYVVGDTGTSPTQALVAAQRLVDQDHVFAVLANTAVTFAAAPFLASKGIPVVGESGDGNEWVTDRNMFSVIGTEDYTKVYSQFGQIFKNLGVTNLAALGYGISPSSAQAAKGIAVSAQLLGIKVGYLNVNVPFGTTNVGPFALAMKSDRVDGMSAEILTSTEFALIRQLRQEGVNMRGVLMAQGYGGDLYSGGPAGVQTAQGLYFLSAAEPVEMHTAATQKLQSALKTYANVTGDPTAAEYLGYQEFGALVQGLNAAGSHPTQASFINAMLGLSDYNGAGLYGSHSLSFALSQRGQVAGVDNCEWVTKFSGSTFHLVSGMDPICGHTVPGKTVSSSS
jgi:ABC-type branched-subunit amino acid transport system substrate-binding protein